MNPPVQTSYTFTDTIAFRDHYPRFWEGILFTNSHSIKKGPLLVSFLEYTQMSPKRLIVIDDIKENLDSIESALSEKKNAPDALLIHFVTTAYLHPSPLSREHMQKHWHQFRELAKTLH